MSPDRGSTRYLIGGGVAACAACCAPPILALVGIAGAGAAATAATFALAGLAFGVAVALATIAALLVRRSGSTRRRSAGGRWKRHPVAGHNRG
jgi:hypothetical protein